MKQSFKIVSILFFTLSENGTDVTGQPVKVKSTLSENAVDFGLTWRF